MLPENINDLKYIISTVYNYHSEIVHYFSFQKYLIGIKIENYKYIFEIYKYDNTALTKFNKIAKLEYDNYKYKTHEIDSYLNTAIIVLDNNFLEVRKTIIKACIHSFRKFKIQTIASL